MRVMTHLCLSLAIFSSVYTVGKGEALPNYLADTLFTARDRPIYYGFNDASDWKVKNTEISTFIGDDGRSYLRISPPLMGDTFKLVSHHFNIDKINLPENDTLRFDLYFPPLTINTPRILTTRLSCGRHSPVKSETKLDLTHKKKSAISFRLKFSEPMVDQLLAAGKDCKLTIKLECPAQKHFFMTNIGFYPSN